MGINGDYNCIETKEDMLRWMLGALMSESISLRKRIAFLEWLSGDEHVEMKYKVINTTFDVSFEG